MTDALVILCTAPTTAAAEKLAYGLVEARLAACVNVVDRMVSIYQWKNDVHRDEEVQLVIKTRAALWDDVSAYIQANHGYEVPEILALPVSAGSEKYLAWLRGETAR